MPIVTAPAMLLGRDLVADAWLVYDDGRVVAVGDGPPPAAPDVVLRSGVLAPGLVDIQCNGAFDHDLASTDDEGWDEVMRRLPELGVTAVVPTFVTAPLLELTAALRAAAGRTPVARGARCLGVHVEGPYLSPARPGAHRVDLLREPDEDEIERLIDAGRGVLRYVTLAPELPGALDAVRQFTAAGIRVAVGHSDATDAQVLAAVDAGATLVTHLYNAQRPLAHRDAGVVGAALSEPRLTVGLIADLEHVLPTALRVAFAAAGDRIALVSDASPTLGVAPGRYRFAGDTVVVDAVGAPPRREDGTLAGSALRLDHAVRNVIACGIEPATALLAATRTPADAVGASDVGRLEPGSHADLVWFDDDWTLRATWVGGHLVNGSTP
ncbi:MAG TPA: N-acetylglucosamine-6-phosphate deacetylase [Egicoccus sp.]|nr:N-acetylglucosamine-6-phosphate deacetylase [Egicoccus sp.]HSK22999.1 N-acetylglucosamine-6-phosphate deacetylase [Egicoccus sp.]